MYRHLDAGDLPAATEAAEAAEAAISHGKAAPGPGPARPRTELSGQAGDLLRARRRGLALLDEAMAGVAAHELTPVVFGDVYCAAIEGCQEIGDFGRVAEWTSALHRWCLAQPGLVAFTGQCSVHRGQLMRVHGAWTEALDEFTSAIERYRRADSLAAVGLAECERGDVLRQRGDFGAAETAYERVERARLRPAAGPGAVVARPRGDRRGRGCRTTAGGGGLGPGRPVPAAASGRRRVGGRTPCTRTPPSRRARPDSPAENLLAR